MSPLIDFAHNIYSQNGEDGVVEEILNRLGLADRPSDRWCVEFGAWDGKYLSNTYNLVVNGWNAIYIESDSEKFADLLVTATDMSRIHAINAFVSPEHSSQNNLDNILHRTRCPKEFEVLSIDVDSYDLDIWESLSDFHPAVVVIEINSSAPPGIIWRHGKGLQGNTFSATTRVAESKGYTAVCHTGNLILVRNDFLEKLEIPTRLIRFPELLFLPTWMTHEEAKSRRPWWLSFRAVALRFKSLSQRILNQLRP